MGGAVIAAVETYRERAPWELAAEEVWKHLRRYCRSADVCVLCVYCAPFSVLSHYFVIVFLRAPQLLVGLFHVAKNI